MTCSEIGYGVAVKEGVVELVLELEEGAQRGPALVGVDLADSVGT